jgi:hypothetical protein
MTIEAKISSALDDAAKRINIEDVFHKESVGSRAVWQTLIDLIFACAPIFLLAILSVLKENIPALSLFGLSDWSLISTFLFGQAVIKMFQLPYNTFAGQGSESATGIVALLICLGLLPSAVIFALIFGGSAKSLSLQVLQMLWFIFSVVAYIWCAFLSNAAMILKSELARRIEINVNDTLSDGAKVKRGK